MKEQDSYLTQVASDLYIVPVVIIELAGDRLNKGLKCSGSQVDDE